MDLLFSFGLNAVLDGLQHDFSLFVDGVLPCTEDQPDDHNGEDDTD